LAECGRYPGFLGGSGTRAVPAGDVDGHVMATTTTIKLVIPSMVRFVDLAHTAAEKMAETAGFDADEALNIGLAVREAAINAIVHGNQRRRYRHYRWGRYLGPHFSVRLVPPRLVRAAAKTA